MTDRFKFRAWDKDRNIMVNVMQMYDPFWVRGFVPDGNSHDFYDEGCGDYLLRNYVLQQCTGMKDSEGNLIWDGDTVSWLELHGQYNTGEVIWENGMHYIVGEEPENEDGKYKVYLYLQTDHPKVSEIKIMGNIFVNPELVDK